MSKLPRSAVATTIADQTLADGISKKLSRELAAYLLTEGRVSELDPLMRDIQSLWAEAGYVNALAISAHPIDAEAKNKIKSRLKTVFPAAKKIIINEQLDPEVIAGVRIELADRQLDLSVASQLNKFKQLTSGEN